MKQNLPEARRKLLEHGRGTVILVEGNRNDHSTSQLVSHLMGELVDDSDDCEYIFDEFLSEIPRAYREASERDTIVITLGNVVEYNPPISRVLHHTLTMHRHKMLTIVLVCERPGEAIRRLVDFEVTPRVYGEVTALTQSRKDPEETERVELEDMRVDK